jgi:hypothetical protein
MISLAEALRDRNLLGDVFAAPSFWPWHCVAKVISGETLDEREAALFRQCTGRTKLLTSAASVIYLLVGRRGGKDRFMSAAAIYRAAIAQDWSKVLSVGEQGVAVLIGADKKQSKILKRYCRGLLEKRMIAATVSRSTDEGIEFRNGSASLEVVTNDAALIRGRSILGLFGTEACHWDTNPDSPSSDEEVVGAALPGMAMIPGGGLTILASSAHRKQGLMFERWKELHGNDDADEIVWLASSRTMNPALPEAVVAQAMARDPQRAAAEFESRWREDVSDFITADIVDAATDFGVVERQPEAGQTYFGFADAAGGTGRDAFGIAVAHRDAEGRIILDCLRERRPRFVPKDVVSEFADVFHRYRIDTIKSDRFASAWASDEWTRNGIRCQPSDLTKSQLYLAALPLLLSGQARLVDNERMRRQFTALERRVHAGGRETVDDSGAASANDDLSNCCAGALVFAAQIQQFTGSSVLEFYRRQSIAASDPTATAAPPIVARDPDFGCLIGAPPEPRQIRFRVPAGTSQVMGMEGKILPIEDGAIAVTMDEASSFRRLQWEELSA